MGNKNLDSEVSLTSPVGASKKANERKPKKPKKTDDKSNAHELVKVITSSVISSEEILYEMVYDPVQRKTSFVSLNAGGNVKKSATIQTDDETEYRPFSVNNDAVRKNIVLFPSDAEEYGSDAELIQDIHSFTNKYVEVSPFFEAIIPFYVLLTWVYDAFSELPYLRAIGDYGTGKSRLLKTVGSVCYKPTFTMGATTTAPLFRLMDQFRGTIVLDEADLKFSDTTSELVKILNNGYQKGLPVLRCADSKQGFKVMAFEVFGPKILATRNTFDDKALESRFIAEPMNNKLKRTDIPQNLTDTFAEEALRIRNKCLLWRLRNWNKVKPKEGFTIAGIDARLNQIVLPLASLINDENVLEQLEEHIKAYHRELIIERGLSFEAGILEAILNLIEDDLIMTADGNVKMRDIASKYNESLPEHERKITDRKVGSIVRNNFRLRVVRKNIGYVLDIKDYREKIDQLKRRFGLVDEQVNDVNIAADAPELKESVAGQEKMFGDDVSRAYRDAQ